MPSLVTERIESVKAGVVGAGAFAIAELVISMAIGFAGARSAMRSESFRAIALTLARESNFILLVSGDNLLVQLAIGAVSGFLFGVTYRYIIRDDRNSHLNDGAVLAFGLVRGLALIEQNLLSELLSGLLLVAQSIICFAIARLILDLAIARYLIKPFNS